MQTVEHALLNGRSLKAVKRKLGIGKNEIYGLRDKEKNVITNMDRIVEVAEKFYTYLYK